MRTFLAGEAEGVCTGGAGGVTDSAGEIDKAGDSPVIADGVGVGVSWAKTTDARNAIRIAVFVFIVMSSAAQRNRRIPRRYRPVSSRDVSTSLDMTLNVVTPVHVWKEIIALFAAA